MNNRPSYAWIWLELPRWAIWGKNDQLTLNCTGKTMLGQITGFSISMWRCFRLHWRMDTICYSLIIINSIVAIFKLYNWRQMGALHLKSSHCWLATVSFLDRQYVVQPVGVIKPSFSVLGILIIHQFINTFTLIQFCDIFHTFITISG